MDDERSTAEECALRAHLKALEAQEHQLSELLINDVDNTSLLHLQTDLRGTMKTVRAKLRQKQTISVDVAASRKMVGVSLRDVVLAPRIFDRYRARAVIEELDETKQTCLVTWLHPRAKRELPCRYWKEGRNCKFAGPDCSFSHGVELALADLLPAKPPWSTTDHHALPDASITDAASWAATLKVGSPLLARFSDGVWYTARVADPAVDGYISVTFDGFEADEPTPIRADERSVYPIDEEAGAEAGAVSRRRSRSDDGEPVAGDSDASKQPEDAWADVDSDSGYHTGYAERILGGCDAADKLDDRKSNRERSGSEVYIFGDWERHTKGFGSRMMARMGYRRGEGLGSEKQGISRPVLIRVLPERVALDHLGEEGAKKVKSSTKTGRSKKDIRAPAKDAVEPQKAMFDFVNVTIHQGKDASSSNSSNSGRRLLPPSSTVRHGLMAGRGTHTDSNASMTSGANDAQREGKYAASVKSKPTSSRDEANKMTKSQLRSHVVAAREAEASLDAKAARLQATILRNSDRDPQVAAQARKRLEDVKQQSRDVRCSQARAERALRDRGDKGKAGRKGGMFSF